ncbi:MULTISPECIES: small secreted protein [Streptomyces]|uniref:Small secreted protein n=1 Tax=Streptomyces venezuelae TaxID=54571 RepID=A0A5P2BDA6_STRVZ|nr:MULTISPECIES: small secreted protein [Streptomyces]NEA01561.1 small secreted protein [Streptomyces sp. SID10116]MYY85967.1 small secreted protein [Streptomyces sp. SID335]MYZ15519.1 small secreted protein [Streptomyces sp. SID337]NDZ91675.1 small secreted protein [Streptomyces sp. SID10115]NEB49234.1 small secreted protein [Streptomyces sp. SID339]
MEGTNPVNKKLAAALSGGAVLVLALSGCSSDDGNKKLDDWAKKVCDSVQPQSKKIADANAAIQKETSDNSSPGDVQKTDSKAFKDMSDAYKSMGDSVKNAGAPPVDDGKKKTDDAVKELNAISKSYGDLKKQVDGLDTKNQADFADGLKDVAGELDKLSKSGNEALEKLQEGEVGKAMGKQDSCKSASATPSGKS